MGENVWENFMKGMNYADMATVPFREWNLAHLSSFRLHFQKLPSLSCSLINPYFSVLPRFFITYLLLQVLISYLYVCWLATLVSWRPNLVLFTSISSASFLYPLLNECLFTKVFINTRKLFLSDKWMNGHIQLNMWIISKLLNSFLQWGHHKDYSLF